MLKSEENDSCIICLSDFEIGIEVKIFPCTHIFHEVCIFNWFKNNSTCPKCKFCIDEKLIEYLSK